jgi:hypothetical protein
MLYTPTTRRPSVKILCATWHVQQTDCWILSRRDTHPECLQLIRDWSCIIPVNNICVGCIQLPRGTGKKSYRRDYKNPILDLSEASFICSIPWYNTCVRRILMLSSYLSAIIVKLFWMTLRIFLIHATCSEAHYSISDLITLITLDEYSLWISCSRSFHHPVTFNLLAVCSKTP